MERSSPKSSMDDSLKEIPDNEKKEETAQEQEQEQDKEKEDKEEEEDEEEDNENEIMDTLTIGHAIPSAQSPFMARQAERAHMTGLSPIEEMRLAQNELRAKAATQFGVEKKRATFNVPITAMDMVKKMKNRSKVAVKPSTEATSTPLSKDVEELTPAEALSFVETASKNESLMFKRSIEHEESKIPFYMISPNGKFRLRWDILAVILITYNAISIPFQLAFEPTMDVFETLQRIVDAYFLVDILLNFVSAYEENGRIQYKLNVIVTHYITGWFIPDLISSFPIYLIPQGSYSRIPQLARILRLFRLVRLFRMLTILRILNRLEYALLLRSAVSSIVKFCFLVCFTSHWLSCFFFLISVDDPKGWVAQQEIQFESTYVKYVTAFYWAIMTMTTVGYGDVHPCTTKERVFCICGMLLGAWIFAYAITNVVTMIANLNASDSIFQLKMDELNEYMEARELPIQLRYEIREFFYNARLSAESKLNNETKILAELSALLRSKIAFAINDSVLNKMPFFVGADHNFLMELALSMRMVCFPPHEEVILEGEIGEEMFFIFRGVVEVLRNGQQITILGEKQYFGEMAILNQNCLRTATVRTLCFCELRMLTREKFLIALNHYPSMKQRIAKIVEQRQKGSAVLSLLTRTFKSSKDFVGSIPADMDDKIEKQLTTSSEKTSNSQLNPVNTTALSRSFKSFTTEADIEQIRSKLNLLMQRQEKMLNLLDRMDEQVGQVNN